MIKKNKSVSQRRRLILLVASLTVICTINTLQASAESPSNSIIATTKILLPAMKNDNLGLIDALQKRHVLELTSAVPLRSDNSNLPKPPDQILSHFIEVMATPPVGVTHLFLVWLRSNNSGGIYTIQGSGDCVTWIIFTVEHTAASNLPTPKIFMPGVCALDGEESYLGSFKHHMVAITIQTIWDRAIDEGTEMAAQSWDGIEWTSPEYLIIRPKQPAVETFTLKNP